MISGLLSDRVYNVDTPDKELNPVKEFITLLRMVHLKLMNCLLLEFSM